jgi:hypothetical protein
MIDDETEFDRLAEPHREEIDRIARWHAYFKAHPEKCPHSGVMGAMSENGFELPGACLACGKYGITAEMQGDTPAGEPPK